MNRNLLIGLTSCILCCCAGAGLLTVDSTSQAVFGKHFNSLKSERQKFSQTRSSQSNPILKNQNYVANVADFFVMWDQPEVFVSTLVDTVDTD